MPTGYHQGLHIGLCLGIKASCKASLFIVNEYHEEHLKRHNTTVAIKANKEYLLSLCMLWVLSYTLLHGGSGKTH